MMWLLTDDGDKKFCEKNNPKTICQKVNNMSKSEQYAKKV